MQGTHLTGDLFECACPLQSMRDQAALRSQCVGLAVAAGLTVVGEHFHAFADAGGVTGLVLLAESHLAIHTWPELAAVTLDVYVCNFNADNGCKAEALFASLVALFAPERLVRNAVLRGVPSASEAPVPIALEWLTPDVAHGFTQISPPTLTQSAVQRIELHQTAAMGRVLSLDGAFMLSERDEFIYHECMVHVPAIAHAGPKRALVMGGGDGCTAREILKHASVTALIVAELDPEVITLCRSQFAQLNAHAFDDPRVRVHAGDAVAFLRESTERFDLIVMDLTDPSQSSQTSHTSQTLSCDVDALYSEATYALIRDRLSVDGIVSLHTGSAFFHPQRFASTLRDLRAVFDEVHAYKAYMPVYGAEWGMACASMRINPRSLAEADVALRLQQRKIGGLRFYSPRVHHSLFAWPPYAEALGA
jgi:spermidine synthase